MNQMLRPQNKAPPRLCDGDNIKKEVNSMTGKRQAPPSPYDYKTITAYCTALCAAGLAKTRDEAQELARQIIPKESRIQSNIMAFLRSKDVTDHGFFWKAAAGPYMRGGIPDIIGVYRGRFMAFEVKRPLLGKPTSLQTAACEKINAAGGQAHVVTSVDAVRAILGLEDGR